LNGIFTHGAFLVWAGIRHPLMAFWRWVAFRVWAALVVMAGLEAEAEAVAGSALSLRLMDWAMPAVVVPSLLEPLA